MKLMKRLTKLATTVGLTCLMLSSTSCGVKDKKLVIWAFTEELETQGDIQYFKDLYTGSGQKWAGYEVELVVVPTEEYLNKLLPVLKSGEGAPDLFTGELDMLQNYMEAGYVADLETLINNDATVTMDIVNNDFVDYIVQSGRDENGVLRGLSWQVTPGGIMFRTDLAVEIWGYEMISDGVDTTSTSEIAAWMGKNKFNSLEQLETSSREAMAAGNYKLFVDDESIRHYASGVNPHKWVVNGILNPEKINDQIKFMETRKEFYGAHFTDSLTANLPEWSTDWLSAINSPIQVPVSNEIYEVIAYSLPTWGLFDVLEPNMPVKDSEGNVKSSGTYGNWGISAGPNPYCWGGTYLVINEAKDDKQKELAFDFMKSMLFDDERMLERAIANGDVYSRISIMNKVQDGFTGRASIGNQNHYDFFIKEADKIDFSYVTKYDRTLNTMVSLYTAAYAKGDKTMEEALNDFYSEVAIVYGKSMLTDDLPYIK